MNTDTDSSSHKLLSLYRSQIRTFLEEQGVSGLESLDRLAEVLDDTLKRRADVSIGFVGESQVGKSTLINALLDRHALPSGGVGPLTAQQTRVRHGAEDKITVRYHGRAAINRLAFALAKFLKLEGELPGDASAGAEQSPGVLEPELELLTEEDASATSDASGTPSRANERATYMIAQGRRMIGANSDAASAVVLDALRVLLGWKPVGDPGSLDPFRERIAELRNLLGAQEIITSKDAGGDSEFRDALRLRAAGWRSPLVERLTIELAAPEMAGLNIVDLPGIGVVGDAAAHEAQKFVESEGNALVVVSRNNGLTESIAGLLERTGVITKLLFGGRDGIAPIQIILVATHLDDVAKTQYSERLRESRNTGAPRPNRDAVFVELASEMVQKTREQLRTALHRSPSFEHLDGAQREARDHVVDRLCDAMSVICVVAPDYLELTQESEQGLAFLQKTETTGIPALRSELHRLADTHSSRRAADIETATTELLQTLDAHLVTIRGSLEDGRGVAVERSERFAAALTEFAEPLKLDMRALHGEVAGTLRRGLLERIQTLCADAENQGLKRLRSLLRSARDLHFQSLNAALRRDGVWEMRDFNFPDALTRAVVDSIATSWEPEIIDAVRSEIRRLADRDLKLVEQLVEKARELDAKIAEERPLEEQKKILQQNSRSAVNWTKEQLEELRDTVQSRLRGAVSKPIELACREAIKAGKNTSQGAKGRILEVFEDSGGAALAEARKESRRVLDAAYKKLLGKLDEGFLKDFHDPVQSALDTLTDQVGARARRSDAQKRRVTLERANALRAELSQLKLPEGEMAA